MWRQIGMQTDLIHRAVSDDGTEIAGRVQGQGPSLVLVHGGLGDGEISWRFMLPFLAEHFTCHQMSTRGRGLSGESADRARQRLFQDVASYVRSVGEPVWLFGHSSGALLAMGAAALATGQVRGVALYEPPLHDAGFTISDAVYGPLCTAAAEGRHADAVDLFTAAVGLAEDERALFSMPEVTEMVQPFIPGLVREIPEITRALDPAIVDALTMPVLLVQGTRSGVRFKEATRYLADRLPHAQIAEIAGVGHMGTLTAPEGVARELIRFVAADQTRAQRSAPWVAPMWSCSSVRSPAMSPASSRAHSRSWSARIASCRVGTRRSAEVNIRNCRSPSPA